MWFLIRWRKFPKQVSAARGSKTQILRHAASSAMLSVSGWLGCHFSSVCQFGFLSQRAAARKNGAVRQVCRRKRAVGRNMPLVPAPDGGQPRMSLIRSLIRKLENAVTPPMDQPTICAIDGWNSSEAMACMEKLLGLDGIWGLWCAVVESESLRRCIRGFVNVAPPRIARPHISTRFEICKTW